MNYEWISLQNKARPFQVFLAPQYPLIQRSGVNKGKIGPFNRCLSIASWRTFVASSACSSFDTASNIAMKFSFTQLCAVAISGASVVRAQSSWGFKDASVSVQGKGVGVDGSFSKDRYDCSIARLKMVERTNSLPAYPQAYQARRNSLSELQTR